MTALDLDELERTAAGLSETRLHIATEDRIWWTNGDQEGCFAECIEPDIAAPVCLLLNAAPALIARVRELEAGLDRALDSWADHDAHEQGHGERARLRALLSKETP